MPIGKEVRADPADPVAQKQGASRACSRPSGLPSLGCKTGSTLSWPGVGLLGYLGPIQPAGSPLRIGSPVGVVQEARWSQRWGSLHTWCRRLGLPFRAAPGSKVPW